MTLTARPYRLAVLPLGAALLLAGCSQAAHAPASPGTGGATAPAASSPAPSGGPAGDATAGALDAAGADAGADPMADHLREPVALDTPVTLESGTTVALGEVSATTLEAVLPGEVAGPGVLVPVTVTNGTDQPVSLSTLVVTVYHGEGLLPSSQVVSASDELPAEVAAGQSTTLTLAFTLPADGRDHVRVVVDLDAADKAAVFEGAVPAA